MRSRNFIRLAIGVVLLVAVVVATLGYRRHQSNDKKQRQAPQQEQQRQAQPQSNSNSPASPSPQPPAGGAQPASQPATSSVNAQSQSAAHTQPIPTNMPQTGPEGALVPLAVLIAGIGLYRRSRADLRRATLEVT